MSEFYLVRTDMARTMSGLVLPHRQGSAVLVVGTHVPAAMLEDGLGRKLEEKQAGVLVNVVDLLRAASDMQGSL